MAEPGVEAGLAGRVEPKAGIGHMPRFDAELIVAGVPGDDSKSMEDPRQFIPHAKTG